VLTSEALGPGSMLLRIFVYFLVYCFFLYYVCFYLRVNKDEYIGKRENLGEERESLREDIYWSNKLTHESRTKRHAHAPAHPRTHARTHTHTHTHIHTHNW